MSPGFENDRDLMGLVAAGSEEAFAELYEQHFDFTRSIIHRYNRDRSADEEIHSMAWFRVWLGRAQFAGTAKFSSWLYSIIQRECLQHYRKGKQLRYQMIVIDNIKFEEEAEKAICVDEKGTISRLAAGRVIDTLNSNHFKQHKNFLVHYATTGSVSRACALAGCSMRRGHAILQKARQLVEEQFAEAHDD